ncbi:GNAT family N-acetyltransferase [Aminipila butyrica]|uniref:GNAT family N-acetyltransferase n=1 Tax=Aminipila butyrica TaxID=433296 RepID=A0A858BR84_9FIRM|nr:GNAT family protein [Aminipila butyrica]QIB68037.1 GNAT family N-acetyltransferase [Aminipila butyrica]
MKILETERLRLRPFELGDAEGLYAYAKNPNVGPHAGWKPHADVAESRQIIEDLFMVNQAWVIVQKETGRLVGSIALEPDKRRPEVASRELGYSLAEDCWGQGLMTEAAQEAIRFGFEELKLEIIAICTGPTNERSARVIEKCGFQYEGITRHCYKIYDGSVRDSRCYSLLKSEWEAQR